jgi:hypothetical protein
MYHRANILFVSTLLTAASIIAASPALAYHAGDACSVSGKIYTAEDTATPALVCNGTTLQILDQRAHSNRNLRFRPTRKLSIGP